MKEYEVVKEIALTYSVKAESEEEAEKIVNKLSEKDAIYKHTYGAKATWCKE
jgi:hypothetical protein|tara:strand:+ start:1216 stop:1371 length:156 start_codon:yes stop_codon:yes gene_type:complete